MERILGRRLRPGEVVHHRNGKKDDNRRANLALFTSQSEHIRLERLGHKFPRANRVGFECEACGEVFFRSAWYRLRPARWCSWACRYGKAA